MMPEIVLVIAFMLVCAGSYFTFEPGPALLVVGGYLTLIAVLMASGRGN